jgi:pilus assembly protein CpaE
MPETHLSIAIIASQRGALEQLRALLAAWDSALAIRLHAGGAAQAARIAEREQPDILLVEAEGDGAVELTALEPLIAGHPGMAVILLAREHSSEFLRRAMRIGLRDVLPLPVAREALLEAVGRVRQRAAAQPAQRRRGKVLAFVGCKGGAGATFIAANIGYALAEGGERKVALLDLDCNLGDAALYVTQRAPVRTLAHVAEQVHRLDGSLLASAMLQVTPNYHVLAAPEDPEQAVLVQPQSIEPLLRVAAAEYDILVVDAGRALDEIALRALDQSDALYAVLQPTLPDLHDAKRLLRALTSLGYARDKFRVIVNRARKDSAISLEDVAEALGQKVACVVPSSYAAVSTSVDQGVPVLQLAPRDPVARALREFAASLVPPKKEAGGGWLRSVLSGA